MPLPLKEKSAPAAAARIWLSPVPEVFIMEPLLAMLNVPPVLTKSPSPAKSSVPVLLKAVSPLKNAMLLLVVKVPVLLMVPPETRTLLAVT